MNNTLHTGGDWYVQRIPTMMNNEPHDKDIWSVYSTQKARYVDAPQNICSFNWHTPAGKANAHLISAAPDLLSALQNLMARCVKDAEHYAPDGNEPIWAFISDASDAIAKAKGEA